MSPPRSVCRVGPLLNYPISHRRLARSNVHLDKIITIEAVNIGKRPVTLSAGWIVLSDHSQYHPSNPRGEQLPCKLEEAERCVMWIKVEEINSVLRSNNVRPVAVCFRDVSGRLFKGPYRAHILTCKESAEGTSQYWKQDPSTK